MLTPHKRLQVSSFLLLLLVTAGLIFFLLRPFFNVLAASLILTVLFSPVYNWLVKKMNRQSLAAILTIAIMLIALLVPLWLVGQLVFYEAVDVYQSVRHANGFAASDAIQKLPSALHDPVLNITRDLNQLLGRFTSNAFQIFSSVVSNVAGFILSFFLVLFTVYYLLKDGHHIKHALMDLSPIANSQENILFERITQAVNGVVKGAFLIALTQGVVAGIGFWLFGLPNSGLWGAVTVLSSLVPTVGTSLAIVPAVLYLLLTGHTAAAVGLTIWGAAAVGLVDNFLGPKIVGKAVRVHPVLVLFSILGGVTLFGFLGFLLGPILMAVFVAMIDMYRHDFKEYLEG